jgi:hypothetical protein
MSITATAPPITAPADTPDPATPATPSEPAAEPIHEKFSPYPGKAGDGKYLKGNPGGPGNPYARRTAALRHAILDVVTPEEIRALAGRLLELAREGDLAAAKLVLSYAIGKPAEAVNPDTLDVQEWQLFRQETGNADQLGQVVEGTPVALLCEMARSTVPILHYCVREQAIKALRGEPTQSAANPAEQVVTAQPSVPNPGDVLPKPRRKRSRSRTSTTTTPDAAAVTPAVAAAGGSTEIPVVAEVAQETPVRPEKHPASEGVNTIVAGERGGVSPPVQAGGDGLPTRPTSTGDLTTPRSPAPGSSGTEGGEAGPDAASRAPSAPTALPGPQLPVEDGGKNNAAASSAASAAAREQPRPAVERVEEGPAERTGGPRTTPVRHGRLHWLLGRLGLRGGCPPSPNGSNGQAHRTDDDDRGQSTPRA